MNRATIVSVLLVMALALSGVASAETLTVWMMKQSDVALEKAMEEAIAEFERLNPDITVDYTVFPYGEYRDRLLVAARAGSPPDVSVVDQVWNPEFAAAGLIEPLDAYIQGSQIVSQEAYFPGAWDSAVYNGRVWGIPFDVGVWEFQYYNRDMFRAAGLNPNRPPSTWDEALEYGEKLTRDTNGDGIIDQWGFAVFGAHDETASVLIDSFIFTNGGRILGDDGKSALNSPEVIDALKFYLGLNKFSPTGTLSRSAEDAFLLFTGGAVAIHLYGEWGQDTVKARAPEMDWAMGSIPTPPGKTPVGTFGGWNAVMYRNAKNKDAAWRFIEYWTSAEVNEKVAALTPANIQAAQNFLRERRDFPELIQMTLLNAAARPSTPIYPQISEVQQDMVQAVLLGTSPEQAVRDATEEINQLIERYQR